MPAPNLQVPPPGGLPIVSEELAGALSRVLAGSLGTVPDGARVVLAGAVVSARDRHRLHRTVISDAILPPAAVRHEQALRALARMSGPVSIAVGPSSIRFRSASSELTVVLDQAEPLGYHEQLVRMASTGGYRLELSPEVRSAWREKLGKLRPHPKSHAVRVRLNGVIDLSAEDARGGLTRETIAASLAEGDEIELFMNRDYLREALEAPVEELRLSAPDAPVLFRGGSTELVVAPMSTGR